MASCEATKRHHRSSACAVSARRMPWSSSSSSNINTHTTSVLASAYRTYQFTLPFEPYRRTCTRFYGRSRALKTGQFFFEPTPHHDGPPFDPMPTSDADPQTSATASHPGDVTRVAARSDSADGGSAVTIFGIVAICYKWGDAKSPR